MSLPILRNSRLLSHVAAATTAVALAIGAYLGADDVLSRIVLPVAAPAADKSNYLPNLGPDWGTQHVNLNRLGNALSDGTLVVLGSSELSSHDLRFVPYRFFPEELKVPTLAYGHAMFQSYGMVSVLESVADSLTPNTRLVIMVSPAWFASGGQLPRSASPSMSRGRSGTAFGTSPARASSCRPGSATTRTGACSGSSRTARWPS